MCPDRWTLRCSPVRLDGRSTRSAALIELKYGLPTDKEGIQQGGAMQKVNLSAVLWLLAIGTAAAQAWPTHAILIGSPTLSYVLGLQLELLTGTQMAGIAYKGSSQISPDLMSNQVSLYFDNPGASTPLVNR